MMNIIIVIIGIACAILLIMVGVIIGTCTSISEFYKESIPMMQKLNKLMNPMCDFYSKMMNDMRNEE